MSPLVLELAVSKWLHDIEDGAELIGKKGTIRTARNIIERLYCIHADNCLCNKFFNPSKLPMKNKAGFLSILHWSRKTNIFGRKVILF